MPRPPGLRTGISLEEAERELILATLERNGGDKRRTAEILGIALKTLYNRLKRYQGAAAATDGDEAVESAAPEEGGGGL